MMVNITINNNTEPFVVPVIIDTESPVTIISGALQRQLNLPATPPDENRKVNSITGGEIHTKGVVNLKLAVGENT